VMLFALSADCSMNRWASNPRCLKMMGAESLIVLKILDLSALAVLRNSISMRLAHQHKDRWKNTPGIQIADTLVLPCAWSCRYQ
jgi:hypothetical protein